MDNIIIFLTVIFLLALVGLVALILLLKYLFKPDKYDKNGFDCNKIHKNGTKYGDFGFDFYGYDADGYSRHGYDINGKNRDGKYNRLFDFANFRNDEFSTDGFLDPRKYHIALTNHASERMEERMGIDDKEIMYDYAMNAYQFGRSARQIKKSSAYWVNEIEEKHNNGIVLIYKNYIYVFSRENVLITVYKNERISL